jgi:hypothetical protein
MNEFAYMEEYFLTIRGLAVIDIHKCSFVIL